MKTTTLDLPDLSGTEPSIRPGDVLQRKQEYRTGSWKNRPARLVVKSVRANAFGTDSVRFVGLGGAWDVTRFEPAGPEEPYQPKHRGEPDPVSECRAYCATTCPHIVYALYEAKHRGLYRGQAPVGFEFV